MTNIYPKWWLGIAVVVAVPAGRYALAAFALVFVVYWVRTVLDQLRLRRQNREAIRLRRTVSQRLKALPRMAWDPVSGLEILNDRSRALWVLPYRRVHTGNIDTDADLPQDVDHLRMESFTLLPLSERVAFTVGIFAFPEAQHETAEYDGGHGWRLKGFVKLRALLRAGMLYATVDDLRRLDAVLSRAEPHASRGSTRSEEA
jgi:hypothetical protein